MFTMLQVVMLTIVALVLVRLLERASINPENQKDPGKNVDPSEAEVVPDGGEHKPVNRIKKYRF